MRKASRQMDATFALEVLDKGNSSYTQKVK